MKYSAKVHSHHWIFVYVLDHNSENTLGSKGGRPFEHHRLVGAAVIGRVGLKCRGISVPLQT